MMIWNIIPAVNQMDLVDCKVSFFPGKKSVSEYCGQVISRAVVRDKIAM